MRIYDSPLRRIERIAFTGNQRYLVGSGLGVSRFTPPGMLRGIAAWEYEADPAARVVMSNAVVRDLQVVPGGEAVWLDLDGQGLAQRGLADESLLPLRGARDLFVQERKACPTQGVMVEFGASRSSAGANKVVFRGYHVSQPLQPLLWEVPMEANWHATRVMIPPRGDWFLSLELSRWERIYIHRLACRSLWTGQLRHAAQFTRAVPHRFIPDPDGERFWMLCGRELFCFHHADLETPLLHLVNDTASFFSDLACHPDGRLVGVASNDSTVKFLDGRTGVQHSCFAWQHGKMRSLCFSPDGTLAAAGSSQAAAVVWDV